MKKLQRIRTKVNSSKNGFQLGGWLDSRKFPNDENGTYLWFGNDNECLGLLYGQKLYRLAKAIVRRFEKEEK